MSDLDRALALAPERLRWRCDSGFSLTCPPPPDTRMGRDGGAAGPQGHRATGPPNAAGRTEEVQR
jgi:hypothetical protein